MISFSSWLQACEGAAVGSLQRNLATVLLREPCCKDILSLRSLSERQLLEHIVKEHRPGVMVIKCLQACWRRWHDEQLGLATFDTDWITVEYADTEFNISRKTGAV